MSYRIIAIEPSTAQAIRDDIRGGGLAARRVVLDEPGAPCRHCLEPGQTGEEMLLFTYQPFTGLSPYAVPSPVFLHAEPCEPFDDAGGPTALLATGIRSVRSYTDRHDLIDGEVAAGPEVTRAIQRLFQDPRAEYLHVYSAVAGCFTCRVDRW